MVPVRPIKAGDWYKPLNIKHHDIIRHHWIWKTSFDSALDQHFLTIQISVNQHIHLVQDFIAATLYIHLPAWQNCNSNGGSNHLLLTFECDDNLIGKEKSNHTASCLALHYFAFPSQSHAHLLSNRHETCPPQMHQANIWSSLCLGTKDRESMKTHGHCVRNISISYYIISLEQGWGHDNLPRAFRCLWRQEANKVGTPCRHCSSVPTMCKLTNMA